jgi:hypothetical protein
MKQTFRGQRVAAFLRYKWPYVSRSPDWSRPGVLRSSGGGVARALDPGARVCRRGLRGRGIRGRARRPVARLALGSSRFGARDPKSIARKHSDRIKASSSFPSPESRVPSPESRVPSPKPRPALGWRAQERSDGSDLVAVDRVPHPPVDPLIHFRLHRPQHRG